jgi:multidrug resistance efflux pump
VSRLPVGIVIALLAYLGMKLVPAYVLPAIHQARAATPAVSQSAPLAPSLPPAPEVPDAEAWTGVLLSPTIELTSRSDTTVKQLNVRVGDAVRAGMVLAELDMTHTRHQLAAAEAAMRASRADTWQANVSLQAARDRQARRNGFVKYGSVALPIVSDEEAASARFESAQASSRVSAAAAAAQERAAQVEALRSSLSDGVLTAPFDGVIATTFAERGAHVRAGAPVIRLVGRGSLRTRFAVPETDASKVRLGVKVRLEWDHHRLEAVVDRVAPEVELSSSSIFVEATASGGEGIDQVALAGRVVGVRFVSNTGDSHGSQK